MNSALMKILPLLPGFAQIIISSREAELSCTEIRLCRNRKMVLVSRSGPFLTEYFCTGEDFDLILSRLCSYSLYTHEESIKRGFIPFDGGIRIGVCGCAVTSGGRIETVSRINSINIRIPSSHPSVAAPMLDALCHYKFRGNILVFSPPRVGKTTLLRHTAEALASPPYLKRVSLIDSRGELSPHGDGGVTLDIYQFYPIAEAVEMAVRTMSPEYIICDEIGGREEAEALISCYGKGVGIIASAHGSQLCEVIANPGISSLHSAGLFDCYCQLSKKGEGVSFKFTERGDIGIE